MKLRIVQTGKAEYRVQQRFLGFIWGFYDHGWQSTVAEAEAQLFELMAQNEALWHYPTRVVGTAAEYELRYLRQRIEEITK